MSAMNDFRDYLASLQPAMATCCLRGMPETWDNNGRARTIGVSGAGPAWAKNAKGFGFHPSAAGTGIGGAIVVADGAELNATSLTLFVAVQNLKLLPAENGRIFLQKSTGYAIQIQSTANRLGFYDGAVVSSLTDARFDGAHTFAVRVASGAVPNYFASGVLLGNGSVVVTPVVTAGSLYLGNQSLYTAGASKSGGLRLFILFNDAILGRAITDQEISELHDAWESIVSVFTPKRTIWLPPDPLQVTGSAPVVYFAGPKNANGIVPDMSGNGRDFAVSGCLQQKSSKGNVIHSAPGRGGVNGPLLQTAVSVGLYPDPWTVSFKCLIRTRGESSGRVFYIDTAGTGRSNCYCNGAPVVTLQYEVAYADGDAVWSFPITPGVSHVVSIRHDKSNPANLPSATVDGEAVVVLNPVARAGALAAAASPRLTLLNYFNTAAFARAFDGDLEIFRIDSGLLTDDQVRQIYLQHALECNVLSHRTDQPVSVAAVAAGGMAGPWRVLSGTHKWDDTGTRRRMLGVTAGFFASREASSQAYGGWYGRTSKGTDAGDVYFPLVANIPKSPLTTGFNGYVVDINGAEAVTIQKVTNGILGLVATTAAGAIAINTEYELFVTRLPRTGLFTVWIRGGAYATWTSLLTGTDNTHTTSACLVGYVDAGGYIADYRQYPSGGTLLPTEVSDLV